MFSARVCKKRMNDSEGIVLAPISVLSHRPAHVCDIKNLFIYLEENIIFISCITFN